MSINAKQLVAKSDFRWKLIGYFQEWQQKGRTDVWGFMPLHDVRPINSGIGASKASARGMLLTIRRRRFIVLVA